MLYFSNKSKSYTFGFTFFIAIDMKYDYTFPLAINTGFKKINDLNKELIFFIKALPINQCFLIPRLIYLLILANNYYYLNKIIS